MSSNPEEIQNLPPLKRALFALKDLRTRLNSMEASQVEPIAIMGLGCRFPGKATSPEKYWRLLHEGIDAIGEVPLARWDAEAFYDPDPDKPGKMITRQGGFIESIDQFDANFFGISPREAASMDPQQRLLLETSWEALENAGIAPERLVGSLTAVYVGISTNDYVHLSVKYGSPDQIDPYIGTGGAFSVAAGRLSYLLGLQGPNLAIDTACSSSLVAVHLACQALRTGQANLAIVAGVNLILTPEASIYMSKARALSPDGRCRTFAAAADGYGRGEGCGAVILKRLSDAQADNDPILAVIRGTAVNHDGRSSGLTVPNGQAQQEVIRAALQNAGDLDPHAINYLEAHGTGTPLGDPIEIRAATAVLGKNRTPDNPLYVGSVKTNIGHLEAAAGIAGLIKLVLALQHEELPPQLHFDEPSPHIAWDAIPVQVVTKRQSWAGDNRLAGLSSFGFSGTNAHVIVGAAPPLVVVSDEANSDEEISDGIVPIEAVPVVAERPFHLLTLSARTDNALRELVAQYHAFLETQPDDSLSNVAVASGNGRSHFEHRLAVVAQNLADAREKLAAALAQPLAAAPTATPKIAFLFTGQGAQYPGMGRQLYQVEPAFKEAMDQCAAILDGYLERPLLSVLFAEAEAEAENAGDAALIHQTAYTQPSLFAIEYALAQVWLSWGVKPTAVMGHSIGEIVAACLAGVFSLEDALKLVYERGRLMQSLPAGGAMAAVFADERCVAAALTGYADQLSIAALNGPQHVVISGTATAVAAVLSRLEAEGVQSRPLTVSHAFHSPLMEPILADFEQAASAMTYHKPRLRLISNLTGRQVQENEAQTAVYWRDHIRRPVQFAPSVQTLLNDGITHFLEIGPQPILLGMARQLPGAEAVTAVASLRRNLPDWQQMLTALGSLYAAGAAIDWSAVYRHQPLRPVRLPNYPFQRKRYWHAATPHPVQSTTTLPETAVSDADEWLYQVIWEPAARLESAPPSPGSWLILADAQGVGEKLAAQVQAQGGHCHVITQTQLQASNQTLAQWLAATAILQSGPLLHVVYLWGLDAADAPAAEAACLSALHLLQHVAAHSLALPKLWLVTAGAQVVRPGEQPTIWQSPLWGLGKTMALEHPKLWGGLMDLDPASRDDVAALLLDEIQQSDGEPQIGWRDGRRYVARLTPADPPPQTRDLPLRPDGSYLITGGLGALGLVVAHWLVQRGARRLILMGRTPLPPRREWSQVDPQTAVGQKIAAIRRLEMAGAAVHTAVVDVGDAAQLEEFLAEYAAEGWPPIRGVVHAAGVLRDDTLLGLDEANLTAVLQPKVQGGWHLHTLLQDNPLDFFVLFSSLAAVVGSPGQGGYGAANQFLCALAHYRQYQGLPALVVNWGPWADVGMASRADLAERRHRLGVQAIELAQGVGLLGRFLVSAVTEITVIPSAPGPLRQLLPPLPLLNNLPIIDGLAVSPANVSLAGMAHTPAQRSEYLQRYVRQIVADVLRLPIADVAPTRNVLELGLDSIMMMEVIQRLDRELGLRLHPRDVFERPSVTELAAHLDTLYWLSQKASSEVGDTEEREVFEL